MLAVLNGIDVFSARIGNVYLNAPCREKIWTKAGPEFGSQQGCVMLIARALYRFKSSGASWREMLAENMGKDDIGYTSTAADKDIWINSEVLPDGKVYYSMVLVYVGDLLCIHKDMSVAIDALAIIYVMKQGSMGPPERYLEENIGKVQTQDRKVLWIPTADIIAWQKLKIWENPISVRGW